MVEGNGTLVVFKQIAGLISCRIVFNKKPTDNVAAGEQSLIQFGSGMDVLVGPEWDLQVREGMHVTAGSSVLDLRSGLKSAPKASAQMSGLEPMACRG
jgi:hypothetical protein